ncbi:hypothetical protein K439DRAFT_1656539 [Ramaria rubella]|nr:hypothetical protein K439DRAFT_1656539 [Ramaria rubella]
MSLTCPTPLERCYLGPHGVGRFFQAVCQRLVCTTVLGRTMDRSDSSNGPVQVNLDDASGPRFCCFRLQLIHEFKHKLAWLRWTMHELFMSWTPFRRSSYPYNIRGDVHYANISLLTSLTLTISWQLMLRIPRSHLNWRGDTPFAIALPMPSSTFELEQSTSVFITQRTYFAIWRTYLDAFQGLNLREEAMVRKRDEEE